MNARSPENNPDSVYSFGTAPALDKLEELSDSPSDYGDCILINIFTIARNQFSSGMSVKELYDRTVAELNEMVMDLATMLGGKSHITNPYVLFYLVDYSRMIPAELYRGATKATVSLHGVIDELRKFIVKSPGKWTEQGVEFGAAFFASRSLPALYIQRHIARAKNMHRIIMLTHCPLDMHLYKRYPTMQVLSSHTAMLSKERDFGNRVFKNATVPFNVATHCLLGDKVHLKPQASRNQKKEILQLAIDEQWSMHTESYVLDKIKKHGLMPSVLFK